MRLAAALLLAGPAWAAQEPPARLSEALALLAGVESALGGETPGCPPGIGLETVLADDAAGRLDIPTSAALDARRGELRLAFSCRALAAEDAKACAPLGARPARIEFPKDKPAPGARPETLAFLCASDLHDLRMGRAAVDGKRGEFVAACLDHEAAGHRDFRTEERAKACALLADGLKTPEETCRALRPLYSSSLPAGFCDGEVLMLAGDPRGCARLVGEPADKELCESVAAYRARRDGAPGCESRPLCAALAGAGAKACEPLERRALSAACVSHYLPRALGAAESALSSAENELGSRAVGGPDGRESAAAADDAAESAARARLRIAALRERLSRLAGAGAATTAPPAPASPETLENRLAALESEAACRARANSAEVMASLLGPGLSEPSKGVLLTAVRPWLERGYNARVLSSKDPSLCDELASLKSVTRRERGAGDVPFELLCKTNYYEALMAEVVVRDKPGLFELCRQRNLVGDRDFKLDSLDVSCGIIAERKGSVDEICARLEPYFDNATIAKSCRRMLRFVAGDPAVCPEFRDEMVRERCEGYAALRKGECAGRAQCLLLRSQPERPQKEAADGLAAAACSVFAREEIRSELARAISADAEALARSLSSVDESGAPDRARAKSADDAVERAARLQVRADKLRLRKKG